MRALASLFPVLAITVACSPTADESILFPCTGRATDVEAMFFASSDIVSRSIHVTDPARPVRIVFLAPGDDCFELKLTARENGLFLTEMTRTLCPDGQHSYIVDLQLEKACVCPEGRIVCSDRCVNIAFDPDDCGSCGRRCLNTEVCSGGSCVFPCPSGEIRCSGTCVDPTTDRNHCGACGMYCSGGQICVNGSCKPLCPSGRLECAGTCIDPLTDSDHCGSCSIKCSTSSSFTYAFSCSGGVCAKSDCSSGRANCDLKNNNGCEVDLMTDPNSCGACGFVCPTGKSCVAGLCK